MLTAEQARLLKTQHAPTPQGIRDRLVMSLLLDLGLRASQVAELRVEDFAESGQVTVRRPKTDSADRMELSADILKALVAYAPYQPKEGLLLRGSRKSEELTDQNMSVRAIRIPCIFTQKCVIETNFRSILEASAFPVSQEYHLLLAEYVVDQLESCLVLSVICHIIGPPTGN